MTSQIQNQYNKKFEKNFEESELMLRITILLNGKAITLYFTY